MAFDTYIKDQGYHKLYGMVAFSGEVAFNSKDPNADGLVGEKFTETKMNPNLPAATCARPSIPSTTGDDRRQQVSDRI